MPEPNQLTHFDDQGAARMVSVSNKVATHRVAVVSGQVVMNKATAELIANRKFGKGDVIEVARLAGIMASKRTSELIPLCHPIPLDSVELKLRFAETDSSRSASNNASSSTSNSDKATLVVSATVVAEQKTGVEMEAFTAVSIACLTVYDMCKSVDRSMRVTDIQLEQKSGGKSGDFCRDSTPAELPAAIVKP